jgi:prepilin-type processing-associated H-X9-DG protein
MPALSKTKDLSQRLVCATNLKGLGTAMMVYANDNDDRLPTPGRWCDLLVSETGVGPKSFQCKSVELGPCNYAMNENLIGVGFEAPADTVLLFETCPGWNQVGGYDVLSTVGHRGDGCNILFVDGHTEFIRTESLGRLNWDAGKLE